MSVKKMKPEENKVKVKFSIRWKVLLGFGVLFLLVYVIALNLFTTLSVNAADKQVKNDLTQTLEGIAETVDVEMLLDLVDNGEPNEAGFSDDERFVTLLDYLVQVQAVEPDAWPYLYIASEKENEIKFVVDVWAASDDPGSAGGFLEPYQSNSGWIVAGLSEQVYRAVDRRFVENLKNRADDIEDEKPDLATAYTNFGSWLTDIGLFPQKEFGTYGDEFGRWASGYMPILDDSGIPVAAVGVDFQADYLNEVRNAVRAQVRNAFLWAMPVLAVIVFLVTTFFTRPLERFSAEAEKVAEGDYKVVDFSKLIKGRFPDEIDMLASVFDEMAQKIRKREMTLRRQVAKLRIEIDQTKKLSEVNEIVETDFFKDLQQRASDLRSKRTKK